ncbi:hypothetical protein SLEP1_g44746 [Rubroshorea leprosula]|uniref:Avr9/Cf-9 rapidly elicited protein n=1 Tax=Rubroshorea leprosula TaxID=152421 RepID=A0AAV5LIV7_9ROSI|nr:hypothetical protein SLEP1_g44746 [Rubroshorea leprosula]
MEQNQPVIAKKLCNMVRIAFFMIRKGITKRKFMVDLNMMLKRGKIASAKVFGNLMFHHHRSHDSHVPSYVGPREYEFSCSSTPNYAFPFHFNKRKSTSSYHNFFACTHAPPSEEDEVVLEMLNNNEIMVEASPALPGFGRTPLVRQLRITDSPFPLRDSEEDNGIVNKKVEEFIKKFYKDLKKQNMTID